MPPTAPKLLRPVAPTEKGFVAKLSGANLVDLIQMECLRGDRQTIRVTSTGARGYLFFDQGQVVHAISGAKKGEEAVYEMLLWEDGVFEVCDVAWPEHKTVTLSWQVMLIESMRRRDETTRDSEPPSREVDSGREPNPAPRALHRASQHPPHQSHPSMKATQETDASRYGVVRAVRFEEDGQVISHLGPVSDLSDVSSYALRLARIIGQSLQLGDFVGLEGRGEDRSLFLFLDEETVVSVEALTHANVSAYRQKAGL